MCELLFKLIYYIILYKLYLLVEVLTLIYYIILYKLYLVVEVLTYININYIIIYTYIYYILMLVCC